MSLQPIWWVLVPALGVASAAVFIAVADWRRADRRDRVMHGLRILVATAAVGVGLRPMISHEVEVPVPTNTDLVILLDRTASMGALDVGSGSRIEAAGRDLAALTAELAGSNITVVVFDDEARVAVPFTTDATAVTTFVRTVGWRPSSKAVGSDISVAVPLATEVLERARQDRPERRRHLVYVGDGEQTQPAQPASFAPLAPLVDSAQVWGYGTTDGGAMPVAPGERELVTHDGQRQLSRAEPEALAAIADQLDGEYVHRDGSGDVGNALDDDPVASRTELRPGGELYWWVALAGAVPLLVLLMAAVRGLREVREWER